MRHNAVRDLIFAFASRGRLGPILERAGLLSEPGVLLDLRRPADVLIERALNVVPGAQGSSPLARLALDVKVINALGRGHLDATLEGSLAAADAYHDVALGHQRTAERCAEQGITYVPMVFTAQGGITRRAEAVLHQIAAHVASAEHSSERETFAEITTAISATLARCGARSTLRRCAAARAASAASQPGPAASLWMAVHGNAGEQEGDDDAGAAPCDAQGSSGES